MEYHSNRSQIRSCQGKSEGCSSCRAGDLGILRQGGEDAPDGAYTIALLGNPNTGKSTVFNALTGLRQHTGNWPGKTVGKAEGGFSYKGDSFHLVDLPGTYSLSSTSEDEEVARDFLLFDKPDVAIVVADATRLERNMNLLLQVLQVSERVVLCVNLLDEARRNKIEVDLQGLSRRLGIPVVGMSARSGEGLGDLLSETRALILGERPTKPLRVYPLPEDVKRELTRMSQAIERLYPSERGNSLWIALRFIEQDPKILERFPSEELRALAREIHLSIGEDLHEDWIEAIYAEAEKICSEVVVQENARGRIPFDIKLDRILTSRRWGFPIMLLLLAVVFWLTIEGSNIPSGLLNEFLVGYLHPLLRSFAEGLGLSAWLVGLLIDGVYLSTAWVVSVMLPPMAIFFPLFTLLEDFGYLPRVAFNLDELFRRSGAHGKQALTMTMGFGCNAAGVVSTRIIDSERERLIAIITNNFSLCNGRWPTQILLATLFIGALVPSSTGGHALSVVAVIAVVLLGVGLMFASSWVLSRTVLRGEVSTFHLELPPYRPPLFWRTLYTSLIERTLVVLWRAIVFAAPAGALIWLCCNVSISEVSIAEHLVRSLDGLGWLMGLNGVILLAYLLAIPANEIVMPTILMLTILMTGGQSAEGAGVLMEGGAEETMAILHSGGWTLLTGINLMLFCLLHHPCSTTIYTIYKETGSYKWTALSVLLPLLLGTLVTIVVAGVWRLVV